jgi:hypothetical protein
MLAVFFAFTLQHCSMLYFLLQHYIIINCYDFCCIPITFQQYSKLLEFLLLDCNTSVMQEMNMLDCMQDGFQAVGVQPH